MIGLALAAAMSFTPCLASGDSIAVGVGQALRGCAVEAYVGAHTPSISQRMPNDIYATAILSAGSNDTPSRTLLNQLYAMRLRVHARRVIWILPLKRETAQIVNSVAAQYGDLVLDLAHFPTRDGIHPRSYATVAQAVVN